MTHDPLCPLTEPCGAGTLRHGYCGLAYQQFCKYCELECACDLILRTRADERDQAVQAIQAELIGWSQETKDATGKLQGHAWRAYLGGLEDAINFVRSAEAGR